MQCPECQNNVADHHRTCPVCEKDLGFPNVRAASKLEEVEALQKRWEEAYTTSSIRSVSSVLAAFEGTIKDSRAVMCRSWGIVDRWVSNDNLLFSTFYREVDAGIRDPEQNVFDSARLPVDATVFGLYFKDIRFAALSLDHRGPEAYGLCSIVLKNSIIEKRATVFEENTLVFCRRRNIVVGDPIPPGYRATWENRHRLGVAKLYELLTPLTTASEFANVLLKQDARTDKTDFIEVHIYGSINRQAIDMVVGPKPRLEEDKVIVSSIERRLKEMDAKLVVFE